MQRMQIIRTVLAAAAAVAVLWVGTEFLLPVALPFLIALLAARLAQKPVDFLCRRGHLPRWLAAGIVVLAGLVVLSTLLWGLFRVVWTELGRFAASVPAALHALEGPMDALRRWLGNLAGRLPEALQEPAREGIAGLFENGSLVAERGADALLSAASGTVTKLPDVLLFVVTTVLATFMACSQYRSLTALARRQVPAAWKNRWQALVHGLRTTLAVWLRAQLKLIGVNFLLLTVGLMLLGVGFPVLFGGLIALIDALPVFGAGTVLLPWSLLSFLQGESSRGIGLLLLYGAAYVTRSALEPRLVGRQMGLHPLLMLLAIYAGYRYGGVAGMLLFPVAALLLKQLWDWTPHQNGADFPAKNH